MEEQITMPAEGAIRRLVIVDLTMVATYLAALVPGNPLGAWGWQGMPPSRWGAS